MQVAIAASPPQKFSLIFRMEQMIEAHHSITRAHIKQLTGTLSLARTPFNNLSINLFKSFEQFAYIQYAQGFTMDAIVQAATRRASAIHFPLGEILNAFFKPEVKERVLSRLIKRKKPSIFLQYNRNLTKVEQLSFIHNVSPSLAQKQNKSNQVEVASQNYSRFLEKYAKDKSQVDNLLRKSISSATCRCCSQPFWKGQHLFVCLDCRSQYHRKCQPRKFNCSFCQLDNLYPLRKIKKKLFIGILGKGTKKHSIEFKINPQDYEKISHQNLEIQIRCLRLKDYHDPISDYLNLFPDACVVAVNKHVARKFEPLSKSSSLKHRKDRTVLITPFCSSGKNKIRISQRFMKDGQRVDVENHLIGVYLLESFAGNSQQMIQLTGKAEKNLRYKSCEQFLKKMKILSFEACENLLKTSFFSESDLTIDKIKIPTRCAITLRKMKRPGRTVFCRHYSCFDVVNFVKMNASATIAQWLCPICGAPAYKFQIDPVYHELISISNRIQERMSRKDKREKQVTEIMVFEDLSFKFLEKSGQMISSRKYPSCLKTIYDLPLESLRKKAEKPIELYQQGEKDIPNQEKQSKTITSKTIQQMFKGSPIPTLGKQLFSSDQGQLCQNRKREKEGGVGKREGEIKISVQIDECEVMCIDGEND